MERGRETYKLSGSLSKELKNFQVWSKVGGLI